jgi:hypothetical protein
MYRLLHGIIIVLVVGNVGFLGCTEDPEDRIDIEQLEDAIATAASVAYAGALAFPAMIGEDISCTTISESCASYPCPVSLTLQVGNACPFPIGTAPDGTVDVTGELDSDTTGTLSASFESIDIDGGESVVVNVSDFDISYASNLFTIAYSDALVNLTQGSPYTVNASDWDVTIDTKGTLADNSDDIITISGDRDSVVGLNVYKLQLTDVTFTPNCTRNPTAGSVVFQHGAATYEFGFHSQCDGKLDIIGTSMMVNSPAGESMAISFSK